MVRNSFFVSKDVFESKAVDNIDIVSSSQSLSEGAGLNESQAGAHEFYMKVIFTFARLHNWDEKLKVFPVQLHRLSYYLHSDQIF